MSKQILNLEELAELETRAKRDLPVGTLMLRAGEAAARAVEGYARPGAHVVIICGPGNNGGDGFACACVLKKKGYRVTTALIGGNRPKAQEAAICYSNWVGMGGEVITDPYTTDKADVVVDALFGTGLKRALSGDYLDAALWFNEREAPHIAIDIPSGLDTMTGRWVGGIRGCIADTTVCMLAPKAGCYMNDGADASGRIAVDELDVSVPLTSLSVSDPEDFAHVLEVRPKNSHKGTFGSVCVVGGDDGFVGAAFLAARAALQIGAGRVTVEVMSESAPALDPGCPELMITKKPFDLTKTTCNIVGCGIGFSDKARARIEAALDAPVPLILDADALRILAESPAMQEKILGRTAHTVITPHPGEAAAILKRTSAEVNADRLACARELALQTGAISILKGIGTVIATRSTRAWINPTGNACLATAGSGDVLSGLLGGLFAQGFDMVAATLGAVWLHGAAVDGRLAGVTAGEVGRAAAAKLEEMRREHIPAWRRK